MLSENYAKLDDLAGTDSFVTPPSQTDLAYILHFQKICKRYNIDFATADEDERDFVIRMAEKSFYSMRLTQNLTQIAENHRGAERTQPSGFEAFGA